MPERGYWKRPGKRHHGNAIQFGASMVWRSLLVLSSDVATPRLSSVCSFDGVFSSITVKTSVFAARCFPCSVRAWLAVLRKIP
jgi:hypothetical protein